MFHAILMSKDETGTHADVRAVSEAELLAGTPGAGVEVDVRYSTLNYKDALALTHRAPIIRKWPLVPGIDAAGIVTSSDSAPWKTGDAVVLNGWGVGEAHWGGLAQRARFRGEWLLALPTQLTLIESMAIGTAGYTAMLCCMALERQGVTSTSGDVLVTGATGGVGSIAVAILAGWGYRVVASTGKAAEADYLRALGAAEIIDRAELSAAGKPLQKERWAAVVDSVGSHTLANACAQTRYGGVVAACGLAQGMDFPATVAPFILRGVQLIGIDSVMCPMPLRALAWEKLALDLDRAKLASMTRIIPLSEAIDAAHDLIAGRVRGRIVVDVHALA